MPYTQDLKELIKRVEATRSARVEKKKKGEEFPPLSLKERQERLDRFHPDYKAGSRKEVRVGPSKGYAVQPEMVNLLEARSRINPDVIDPDPRGRRGRNCGSSDGSGAKRPGDRCHQIKARGRQHDDG
jgi:hypothetical protein